MSNLYPSDKASAGYDAETSFSAILEFGHNTFPYGFILSLSVKSYISQLGDEESIFLKLLEQDGNPVL